METNDCQEKKLALQKLLYAAFSNDTTHTYRCCLEIRKQLEKAFSQPLTFLKRTERPCEFILICFYVLACDLHVHLFPITGSSHFFLTR